MIKSKVQHQAFSFFLYFVLQVAFMQSGGIVSVVPFCYVGALILLPLLEISMLWFIIAFGFGVVIDIFQNTMGVHALACVLMMAVREVLVRQLVPYALRATGIAPTVKNIGWSKFYVLSLGTILMHHSAVFFFDHQRVFFTKKVLNSGILSIFITYILLLGIQGGMLLLDSSGPKPSPKMRQ